MHKKPAPRGKRASELLARDNHQFSEKRAWNVGQSGSTAATEAGSRLRRSMTSRGWFVGAAGRHASLTTATARQATPRRETKRNIKLSGIRSTVHQCTRSAPDGRADYLNSTSWCNFQQAQPWRFSRRKPAPCPRRVRGARVARQILVASAGPRLIIEASDAHVWRAPSPPRSPEPPP